MRKDSSWNIVLQIEGGPWVGVCVCSMDDSGSRKRDAVWCWSGTLTQHSRDMHAGVVCAMHVLTCVPEEREKLNYFLAMNINNFGCSAKYSSFSRNSKKKRQKMLSR